MFYYRIFATTIIAISIIIGNAGIVHSIPQVILGDIVRITPASSGNVTQVMWAYAHPTDGHHLMACGMMSAPQGNVTAGYVYSSDDDGITWDRTMFENSTKFISEESCMYGSGTKAYFITGASNFYNGMTHHETGHLHVYTSNDAGMTWHRVYTRTRGWIDWTYPALMPDTNDTVGTLVIFGNKATDRLGHWYSLQPVVIQSADGGHTFSELIAPADEHRYEVRGVFSGGSAVLSDGTVLFAASDYRVNANVSFPRKTKVHSRVDIFAYAPHDKTFNLRATLDESESNPWLFLASLAQDRSRGKFNGRLYAAWVITNRDNGKGDASVIRLAVSDDNGFHWSSRTVLSSTGIWPRIDCEKKSIFDEVHLVVNHAGTLGILWAENDRDLLFASSRDGGRTFSSSTVIVAYAQPYDMRIIEALPSDDYWQASELAIKAGKPDLQTRWDTLPGLALILESGSLESAQNALAVDARGIFHAFWALPRDDNGERALFTRSIDVSHLQLIGQQTLSDPKIPHSCMFLTEREVRPALPATMPVLVAQPGQHEVTQTIAMNPLHYKYNALLHTISIDAELMNIGKTILKSPLTLVGTNLHSDFGMPIALNAQGTLADQPVWHADHAIPASGLIPGAHSKLMHFVFRVERFHVPPSLYYSTGDGVAMKIRMYEGKVH